MNYYVFGLGNPGEEYDNTRHNTGRIMLEVFRKKNEFSEWQSDSKIKALVSKGKVGKSAVTLVEPETFMNGSGLTAKYLIKNKKQTNGLITIHDDLDIPFGKFKISFNKSSGGHKGIESIISGVKTQEFIRIRVGISPANAKGAVKKPSGEKAVCDFILGKFKKQEEEELKKVAKTVAEAISMIITEGKEKAMGKYNG